ncbi:MAG: hypothetical protein H0U67_07025 [Gemmatimonadetes bacterium]|nr:hypothetical protein [Gemmatimonadota bacterium]
MSTNQPALDAMVVRLNAKAWGITLGLLLGGGLFVATNFLLLKGGDLVGPRLGLLAIFFPGYSVTFAGSLIGFVYLFVIGYGVGAIVGRVYNQLVGLAG